MTTISQQQHRLSRGDIVEIIGGVHRGKFGTFLRRTDARVAVQIQDLENERFLKPEHIKRAGSSSSSGRAQTQSLASPCSPSLESFSNLQQHQNLIAGCEVSIVGGSYEGSIGTFLRRTPKRVCIKINGVDGDKFLLPKFVIRRTTHASTPRSIIGQHNNTNDNISIQRGRRSDPFEAQFNTSQSNQSRLATPSLSQSQEHRSTGSSTRTIRPNRSAQTNRRLHRINNNHNQTRITTSAPSFSQSQERRRRRSSSNRQTSTNRTAQTTNSRLFRINGNHNESRSQQGHGSSAQGSSTINRLALEDLWIDLPNTREDNLSNTFPLYPPPRPPRPPPQPSRPLPSLTHDQERLDEIRNQSLSTSLALQATTLALQALSDEEYHNIIPTLPTECILDPDQLPTHCRDCIICLDAYVEGDIRKILPCLHGFHQNCVDSWLHRNNSCPVCRANVRANLFQE